MKKFEVKAGQPFEGQITINVVMEDPKAKKEYSFKKAVVLVAIAMIFAIVGSAAIYGVATSDYSTLKAFADVGLEGLNIAVKAAAKALTK